MKRHRYLDNPDWPGTCWHCSRADPDSRNEVHKLEPVEAAQREHRRRAGDQEEE